MSDVQVSRYWANNLGRLEEMLVDGLVYVDFVMRGTKQKYDIMLSDRPFSTDTPEKFTAWNENSICAYTVSFANIKTSSIYSLWEVHSLAAILTVSGHEVMIGNQVRRTGGKGNYNKSSFKASNDNMLSKSFSDFKKSTKTTPGEEEREPDYSSYSDALNRGAADVDLYGDMKKDSDTFYSEGDIPKERFVPDEEGNGSLMEEGM